jgi:predicted naringenin-chalcone synthase
MTSLPAFVLSDFSMRTPRYRVAQTRLLEWLAEAHAEAQVAADAEGADAGARDAIEGPETRAEVTARMTRLIRRCACGPAQIDGRGVSVPDFGDSSWSEHATYALADAPHGPTLGERTERFAAIADAYFEEEYAEVDEPPADIVHVTCTGYASPSAAQRLVARRGWGDRTRVTHAYHMGCYASLPALRIAAGCAVTAPADTARGGRRVDVVHTEVCSLHLDPTLHSIEQLVVQSLFADGFIRYALRPADEATRGPGLRLLATHETILPDSAQAMTWTPSEWGHRMTLARDVPERIAGALRGFVAELYRRAGRDARHVQGSVFAVHPGGPRIIDRVGQVLELDDTQLARSREVLFDHGNMSSATLPHVWMRVLADPGVAPGTLVASLAFGPGLTCSGGLFETL